MRKLRYIAAVFSLLAVSLLPATKVFATSASVFVSPSSSSVTTGNNISVQVRVNSGANQFDTAEVRLNYTSSKLQYVGVSGGVLATFQSTPGSGYYEYVGFSQTGPKSGNQLLFTITFKSVASGTASLSLSGVTVANAGTGLAVSTSGGSISISDPAPSSGGSSGGTTSTPRSSTGTSTPAPAADTTAPVLAGEPSITKTQSTIDFGFKTDEASTATLNYYKEGAEKQQLTSAEPKTEHSFDIGKDNPLEPGTTYKLELTLTDAAGNTTAVLSYDVRTTGVTYRVRVVDSAGQPLRNHPVQLFSDPISATTDDDGVARFDDVTPGEHTLVFDIEGITIRQPVLVGNQLSLAGGADEPASITMPFQLAQAVQTDSTNWLLWLGVAFLAGAVLARLPLRKLASKSAVLVKSKVKTKAKKN